MQKREVRFSDDVLAVLDAVFARSEQGSYPGYSIEIWWANKAIVVKWIYISVFRENQLLDQANVLKEEIRKLERDRSGAGFIVIILFSTV